MYTKDVISVKRTTLIMRESFVFLGTTLFLIVRKPSTSCSSTYHPILQVSVPSAAKDHFTVVCSKTWPLNGRDAGRDLVLIQTSLLWLCKSSRSYAHWLHLHNKSRGLHVYQSKITSNLHFMGQDTQL